ncbi:MAG: ribonuclease R [Chloroflexota bacterium]
MKLVKTNEFNREEETDKIIKMLRDSVSALNLNEISKSLGIKSTSPEYDLLKELLYELSESGVVLKSSRRKYSLHEISETNSLKGVLHIRGDVGAVETESPDFPKIIIRRRHLNTALEGDLVLMKLHALKKNKKPRGEITEVLERNKEQFVGTIEFDGNFYFLIPDEPEFYVDFLIPPDKTLGARDGDKVYARFLQWDNPNKSPLAEVAEIIGLAGDPKVEFDSIIKEFSLPTEFPKAAFEEAKKYAVPSERASYKGRLDLRDEIVITIDPADARDFDDAISLKKLDNGNLELGVHIADVSHYVTENSELDIEARNRANSIYLVDRVIPMLPEELSNNICSLKPNETRLTFSVMMELSPRGALKNYSVTESVIKSARRYSYEEALDIIRTGEGDYAELLQEFDKLAKLLRKKRFSTGGIDFETSEVKFKLDERNFPVEAVLKRPSEATKLIEEFMLLANKTVAEHVEKISKQLKLGRTLPFLYRIHDKPDQEMLLETLGFVSSLGIKIDTKKVTSKDINKVLREVSDKPEKELVNQILIRSMQKAVYSAANIGHYGLGFKDYSHFTSPIRRYADLFVHRALKEYAAGRPEESRIKFMHMLAKSIANITTERERLAMEAERASNKLSFALLTDMHVGEEFFGVVSGVTAFGIFVKLDTIMAEGLIHIRDLRDDYYYFDEPKYRLIGKRHKRVFALGSRLRVKIVKVSIEKRSIDLEYLYIASV